MMRSIRISMVSCFHSGFRTFSGFVLMTFLATRKTSLPNRLLERRQTASLWSYPLLGEYWILRFSAFRNEVLLQCTCNSLLIFVNSVANFGNGFPVIRKVRQKFPKERPSLPIFRIQHNLKHSPIPRLPRRLISQILTLNLRHKQVVSGPFLPLLRPSVWFLKPPMIMKLAIAMEWDMGMKILNIGI